MNFALHTLCLCKYKSSYHWVSHTRVQSFDGSLIVKSFEEGGFEKSAEVIPLIVDCAVGECPWIKFTLFACKSWFPCCFHLMTGLRFSFSNSKVCQCGAVCAIQYSQHNLLFCLFQEQESHWAIKHQAYACKKSLFGHGIQTAYKCEWFSTILMGNQLVNRIPKVVQKIKKNLKEQCEFWKN